MTETILLFVYILPLCLLALVVVAGIIWQNAEEEE